jgi:hypothetical protein
VHSDSDGDVTVLLRDPRLRAQSGKTVISGIVGQVTQYLSQCCESVACSLEESLLPPRRDASDEFDYIEEKTVL